MKKPKIYLAGPGVFRPDALAHGEMLKGICAAHGAVGLFPFDNEVAGEEPGPRLAHLIKAANLRLIAEADAVIADMDPFRGPSTDVGTAFEMGVAEGFNIAVQAVLAAEAARARTKPVVGYSSDRRAYLERVRALTSLRHAPDGAWRDGRDMSVEDFGLTDNLMIGYEPQALCGSAEEAVAEVLRRLGA